jgi:hypothetical protein
MRAHRLRSGPTHLVDFEIDPDTGEMIGIRMGDQSMPLTR